IRKRLGIPTEGARVRYVVIFRELRAMRRITELIGGPCLKSWWDTVMCACAFSCWEGPNAAGVLNSFDLATTEDGASGHEHADAVPFIALELLTEDGLAGKTKHVYAHDAE
ncbi:hypothetical protein EV363DRAFT_1108339, partial [Boletus edulis]